MPVIQGLKKLLAKKDLYDPPHKYKLTHKERESIIVFFSLVCCVTITTIVLLAFN